MWWHEQSHIWEEEEEVCTWSKGEGCWQFLFMDFLCFFICSGSVRVNHNFDAYGRHDFRLIVNFEEAFGIREVQTWKYKEHRGQIRYHNTPSIFDAYRAHVTTVFGFCLIHDVFVVVRGSLMMKLDGGKFRWVERRLVWQPNDNELCLLPDSKFCSSLRTFYTWQWSIGCFHSMWPPCRDFFLRITISDTVSLSKWPTRYQNFQYFISIMRCTVVFSKVQESSNFGQGALANPSRNLTEIFFNLW